jgi:hypothetical protein
VRRARAKLLRAEYRLLIPAAKCVLKRDFAQARVCYHLWSWVRNWHGRMERARTSDERLHSRAEELLIRRELELLIGRA